MPCNTYVRNIRFGEVLIGLIVEPPFARLFNAAFAFFGEKEGEKMQLCTKMIKIQGAKIRNTGQFVERTVSPEIASVA